MRVETGSKPRPALRPGAELEANSAPGLIDRLTVLVFLATIGFAYGLAFLPSVASGFAYIAIHLMLTLCAGVIWIRGRLSLQTLVLVGVLARLLVFPVPIFSSNDVERYLWDGAVALNGFDPYRLAPDDAAVAGLREVWPTPPEHARFPTIYPPGALALFALSAVAGPVWGVWVWKAMLSLAGLLSVLVFRRLAAEIQAERHFALFALSPLLILETGLGGHLDGLLVLLIAGGLLLVRKNRPAVGGFLFGVGTAIKIIPILIVLSLLLTLRKHAGVRLVAGSLLGVASLYGGAILAGLQPIGIIADFLRQWRFGSPLFAMLDYAAPTFGLLMVIALLAVGGAMWVWRLTRRGQWVLALTAAVALPLVLSPVVFPWYLSSLVVLAALQPNAFVLLWVSAAPLTYEVLGRWHADGVWAPAFWPLAVIAIAQISGLVIDQRRSKGKSLLRG